MILSCYCGNEMAQQGRNFNLKHREEEEAEKRDDYGTYTEVPKLNPGHTDGRTSYSTDGLDGRKRMRSGNETERQEGIKRRAEPTLSSYNSHNNDTNGHNYRYDATGHTVGHSSSHLASTSASSQNHGSGNSPPPDEHKKLYKTLNEETQGFLKNWFDLERKNQNYELEVRFPNIPSPAFHGVLKSLQSNKAWSKQFVTKTTDKFYPSKKRVTIDEDKHTTMVIQKKIMRPSEDVSIASLGRSVRFSLQQEEIKGFSEEDGEPNYLRYKTRYTFIHKDEIKYELTEVQSKPVSRKPEEMIHEIELEWCGSAKGYTTEICIGKLLYKVTDMLLLIKKHTHS